MNDLKLENIKKVHIVGIGGSGVSSLAYWFLEAGATVSGSDREKNDIIADLQRLGVNVAIGHVAENVAKDLDLVIYSPAILKNNPELRQAAALNLPALSHFEAVGMIAERYHKVIAITGTNGKSTTTAMLATIAEQAGLDPAVIMGSRLNLWGRNCRAGKSDLFVVEADDYQRKFLSLRPTLAVITNIEPEHLDYYKDLEDVKSAFGEFLSKIRLGGSAIINADDKNSQGIRPKQSDGLSVYTYGKNGNYLKLLEISEGAGLTTFRIELPDEQIRNIKIKLPGEHNVYNALAAYSAALDLDIKPEQIEESLFGYKGIERRFQFMGNLGKAVVYSDYGHHPSAIVHTMRGARKFFPSKKILLVFQPHQHNRTKNLFNDFVESLVASEPDLLVVVEIYDVAGRTSQEDSQISSEDLVEQIGKELPYVYYARDLGQTEKLIREKAKQFDVILIMGAGDIHKVAQRLVAQDGNRFFEAAQKSGLDIKKDFSLKELTTWKIGGPAQYLIFAETIEALTASLNLADKWGIKSSVMGGGSNILVSDEGFEGLVVVNKVDGIKYGQETVTAGSGVAMGRLAADSLQKGYSGLEWAVGLPGTVGGAVFGNSNCWGGSIGVSLKSVVLWKPGEEAKEIGVEFLEFDYDFCKIQKTHQIVLEATFNLQKVPDKSSLLKLREKIADLAKERSEKQPLGARVAGSVFKALKQTPQIVEKLDQKLPNWREGLRDGFVSAGFIIDKGLGLKGYTLGQVQISDVHANFFINLGSATASEMKKLIDFIKEQCKNRFGIELEEEIKYIE